LLFSDVLIRGGANEPSLAAVAAIASKLRRFIWSEIGVDAKRIFAARVAFGPEERDHALTFLRCSLTQPSPSSNPSHTAGCSTASGLNSRDLVLVAVTPYEASTSLMC
jgi:hypothetical protein